MDNLINLLFPPKCLICGQVGEVICEHCLSTSSVLSNQYCLVCGKPSKDGYTHRLCSSDITPTQNISIFEYEGVVRDVIKKAKFGSKQFMGLKKLAFESSILLKYMDYDWKGYICVPIPISKQREKFRGFNHAGTISYALSKVLHVEKDYELLGRLKNTQHQFGLSKESRFENLRDAFCVLKKDNVFGKSILLVDDICTSGATLLEASKTLYKSGAKDVKCFTVCRKMRSYVVL